MTAAELRKFSGEHLFYEIRMFFEISRILKKGIDNVYIHNALLESFIIHASIILDFFYKPQMKKDDARAVHFMGDIPRWKALRPPFDQYYRKFYRRRNREVVHLSYSRLGVCGEEKIWDLGKVTDLIQRLVDTFLKAANPDLLHPNMYQLESPKGQ